MSTNKPNTTESPETAATPEGQKLSFFQLIWNGPPNEARIAGKRWYQIHSTTIVMLITFLLSIILPAAVDALNGVPDPTRLEQRTVRILQTRETNPHFVVMDTNGQKGQMEWPVRLSFKDNKLSHVWSDAQRVALAGCEATVSGETLRYLLSPRYRIWTLDCPEKNIHIKFAQTKRGHQLRAETSLFSFHWLPTIICGLALSFIFVVFRLETRGPT